MTRAYSARASARAAPARPQGGRFAPPRAGAALDASRATVGPDTPVGEKSTGRGSNSSSLGRTRCFDRRRKTLPEWPGCLSPGCKIKGRTGPDRRGIPRPAGDRTGRMHGEEKMKTGLIGLGLALAMGLGSAAPAEELSLAYFMGPKHPMNRAVFTPFAEKLAELSGGSLTVRQFPGGALNSVPPKQYAILLDGVADIIFTLPGYTADVFPMTNVVSLPGVCDSSVDCTEALLRARSVIEKEYNAKLLAVWANAPPVLITRDKPVRRLEDLAGMKIRVASKTDVPFVEALGASAVAQPVTVINQNLANGVIDAIAIGPSAIGSFKLHEPGNYITTWFPGSGSAFVLLMNRELWDSLSDEQKGWVEAAADESLSLNGGRFYDKAAERGMKIAAEAGLEMIELSDAEKARWNALIEPVLEKIKQQKAGSMTVGEIMAIMKGE
ncbi:MAG: hypothetical protein D6754_13160 [Alphaproteobacteria bacterium]|nr:MAG: hypothetical protein D6754_13160 [Alphaproteobacteria bacterium]